MPVENRKPKTEPQPVVELAGVVVEQVASKKVNYGTEVAYFITLRTKDPKALALGTLRVDTVLEVALKPKNEPQKANQQKEFK